MPNELELSGNLSQEEKNRLITMTEQSSSFVAVNLELKENAAYAGKKGYNVEDVSHKITFIDDMLSKVDSGIVTMSPQMRASLTMQKGRYHSFMQLNDGKFSGDSKEMAAVKKQLGTLETLLKMSIPFDDKTFLAIETQYDFVIKACKYYVKNKNPWFATGIARKQMVEETLARVSDEKKIFIAARDAYNNGLFADAGFTTCEKLMEAQLTVGFKAADSKQAFDKEMADERRVNKAWMDDIEQEENFAAFYEQIKLQNEYLTEEDAKYHFYNRLLMKICNYDVEKHGQPSPILKDAGGVYDVVKHGIDKNVATKGDLSRKIMPGLYFVRRNRQGEPISDKDRQRSEANDEYLRLFKEYYDVKALKKEAGDNPSEEVNAKLENAKRKLWDASVKRTEDVLSRLRLPTPEELEKDPHFIEKMIGNDFDLFMALMVLPVAGMR
jgi:hypothetical protein